METIALRFGETFSPENGTICAHQVMISRIGFVWYGKLGNPISKSVAQAVLKQNDPQILLIRSGGPERYWLHVDAIQRELPDLECVPDYYRAQAKDFGCWFRVREIEPAKKNVMSECIVKSSGKTLSLASRHSMSPYFIIEYMGD